MLSNIGISLRTFVFSFFFFLYQTLFVSTNTNFINYIFTSSSQLTPITPSIAEQCNFYSNLAFISLAEFFFKYT